MIAHLGQQPGASSRGVENVIDLNGLKLNDRTASDRYMITGIDGVNDADIRDARAENPQDHGETAFHAFYGGRTITLEGYIKAGSISKLRQMEEDLRSAVGSIDEFKIKFNRYTFENAFSSSDVDANYSSIATSTANTPPALASSLVSASNGIMRFQVSGGFTLYGFFSPNKNYIDSKQAINATMTNSSSLITVITKWVDASNWVGISISPTGALARYVINGSSAQSFIDETTIGTATTPLNIPYYWTVVQEGDYVVVQRWASTPSDTGTAEYTYLAWIAGAGQNTMGRECEGRIGIGEGAGGQATANRSIFWEYNSYGLRPGDVELSARKTAPLAIKESQVNNYPRRDFLITLRASNPRFTCTQDNKYFRTVLGATSTVPSIFIENTGNFFSQPVIRIAGAVTSAAITIQNETTGQTFSVSGLTLTSSQYANIDIKNRTFARNDGTNLFSLVSSSSDWLVLNPGANKINFTQSGAGATSYIQFTTKSTYL